MSAANIETLYVDNRERRRGLVYDAQLEAAQPDLIQNIGLVNATYQTNTYDTLRLVTNDDPQHLHRFQVSPATNGRPVDVTMTYTAASAKASEALILFGGISDVAPRTDAKLATTFAWMAKPRFLDVWGAEPHSWNQATKSIAIHDLLEAEGRPMPVITVYGPIPLTAWSACQRKDFAHGNFEAAVEIVDLALQAGQEILHGSNSQTQLGESRHYNGLGLGASFAIAAASAEHGREEGRVATVTGQELVLGHKKLREVVTGQLTKEHGKPSQTWIHPNTPFIPELAMRRDFTRKGNELRMHAQMIAGALKLAYLRGLAHEGRILDNINFLSHGGVPVTAALAANSYISRHTEALFLRQSEEQKHVIRVNGVEGQMVDRLINENVVATTVIALRGINKSLVRQPAAA